MELWNRENIKGLFESWISTKLTLHLKSEYLIIIIIIITMIKKIK